MSSLLVTGVALQTFCRCLQTFTRYPAQHAAWCSVTKAVALEPVWNTARPFTGILGAMSCFVFIKIYTETVADTRTLGTLFSYSRLSLCFVPHTVYCSVFKHMYATFFLKKCVLQCTIVGFWEIGVSRYPILMFFIPSHQPSLTPNPQNLLLLSYPPLPYFTL